MKKFIFSAVALIGFTVASYGANAVDVKEGNQLLEKAAGICTYTITTTLTYSDGSTYSYDTEYSTIASSLRHCMDKAQAHVDRLNAQ